MKWTVFAVSSVFVLAGWPGDAHGGTVTVEPPAYLTRGVGLENATEKEYREALRGHGSLPPALSD